jgi:hypothetical protein
MKQQVFESKKERNEVRNTMIAAGVKGIHRFTSLASIIRPEDGGTTWRTVYVLSYPTEGLPTVALTPKDSVDELIHTVVADEPEEPITVDVTDMVSEGSPVIDYQVPNPEFDHSTSEAVSA